VALGLTRSRIAALFGLLFVLLLTAKLCHIDILWAEEGYGSAGAVQILHGKMIYRDFWFDKPPLAALIYLLWHGRPGFWLRFGGAVYALLCCAAAYRLTSYLWSKREGAYAAALMGFFLIFDLPVSVMTLGPDLLMVLPSLAAVDCAARNRPFRSGLWCSVALATNAKALLIVLVSIIWCGGLWSSFASGFALGCAPWLAWLAVSGSLPEYWRQVWWFGSQYSRDTFLKHPAKDGLLRTLNWAGFHACIVIAAATELWRREWHNLRWWIWLAAGAAGVVAGERFFPRYYFILLPPILLLAARTISTSSRGLRFALLALLLIPAIRFGPRYVLLAKDAMTGREPAWSDIQLNSDSRVVSRRILNARKPADTLLVWGYRPDLFAYTQMPVAGMFLDSQMLTGVIADRHLTDSRPTFPDLAANNRGRLAQQNPTFIVDGLGKLNPALAMTQYADFQNWLKANYTELFQTPMSVVYRRVSPEGAQPTSPVN